ncbi:MAG: hypothetical protein ACI4Q4_09965 [Oscillospiraceae bacterium]
MAEKEYIEREATLAYMSEVKAACISNFEYEASAVIAGMICEIEDGEIPAADVVEVVRCKNCRHVNDGYRNASIFLCRKFYENPVSGNDYCRWGEPKDTTSADSEPVKHGHWVGYETKSYKNSENGIAKKYYRCSSCRNANAIRSNYCPNCGAKMDGGD